MSAMRIAVDTSVIIAVIADEPERAKIIEITKGATIVVPPSVQWEVGNAFSAMLKRTRITLEQAIEAIDIYQDIFMEVVQVDLKDVIRLAGKYNIYAYDAYILQCAIDNHIPLMSLDKNLIDIAQKEGVPTLEV